MAAMTARSLLADLRPVRRGYDPEQVVKIVGDLLVNINNLECRLGQAEAENERIKANLRAWQSGNFVNRQEPPPGRASRVLPPPAAGGLT
jgi:hypothetical protein